MQKTSLLVALLFATTTPAFAQTVGQAFLPVPSAYSPLEPCQQTTAVQTDSAEQAVLKVTQEWLAADERQDRAALNRIIGDDFLGTGPMGRTVSKKDIIPREGTDAAAHGLMISGQDMKARIFGDTAIVTGRGVPKAGSPEDRPELRFTIVFVKRSNTWQMVAGHLSPIPTE
jgi:ketosteroid isomerase-like protein